MLFWILIVLAVLFAFLAIDAREQSTPWKDVEASAGGLLRASDGGVGSDSAVRHTRCDREGPSAQNWTRSFNLSTANRYYRSGADSQERMDQSMLLGRILDSVFMAGPWDIHPAWVDTNTASIVTSVVSLGLLDGPSVQVLPCEVPVQDAYPALGIQVERLWGHAEAAGSQMVQCDELQQHLPSAVVDFVVWDSLGDGVDSAIRLALANGVSLTIRHMLPPMTLGIEVSSGRALSAQ